MRTEVILIEPPANLLIKRPAPTWVEGDTNQALGEFARAAWDAYVASERDKAEVAAFIADYKQRMKVGEK